jgi:hypothetical protein
MDKFEQSIKNAKEPYQPSVDFVDQTMQKITGNAPRRRWNIKIWAPIMAGGLAVLAIVLISLPFGSSTSIATKNTEPLKQQTSMPTQTSQKTTTLVPGTDNASLESDLMNVQGALTQENTDQTSANSALNDSQYEIAIPTS